jgi:hypothetical protein
MSNIKIQMAPDINRLMSPNEEERLFPIPKMAKSAMARKI